MLIEMDNLAKRRTVAAVGLVIAFIGLSCLLWGILKKDGLVELIGFISIILAYVCTILMKRLQSANKP